MLSGYDLLNESRELVALFFDADGDLHIPTSTRVSDLDQFWL